MFKIHHFKKSSSTNEKAREFNAGDVIVTDIQTKGRGRHKRIWFSNKGGIWLSIVLKPKTNNLQELTFIASVAVQRAIKKTYNVETKIKWPNDIIHNNKKLCGILTETIFKDRLKKMIVGIGLNVNNKLPSSLRTKAISLKDILKKDANRKTIINYLLNQFERLYKEYNKEGFKPILEKWKSLCGILDKKVKVVTTKRVYHGKVIDVDSNCSLILKLKNGSTKKIIEGDVLLLKKA